MKICTECKTTKDTSCFHKNKNKSDGLQNYCKDCRSARHIRDKEAGKNSAYREKNREKIRIKNKERNQKFRSIQSNRLRLNEKSREYDKQIKIEVFMHYSNGTMKCACCGENYLEFLSIDHINNNGSKHRKELDGPGTKLHRWLKKNNYPEGFQVLCMNCNFAKGHFGRCPHER